MPGLSDHCAYEHVDGIMVDVAFRCHILNHPTCQPGIGRAENNSIEMPNDHVAIAQRQDGSRNLTGDHFPRLVVEVLVVRRVSRVSENQADPRSAAGTPASLGIIVGAGRNIAHHNGIQTAHVDAHFQRRRAGQEIDFRLLGRGFELLFQIGSVSRSDLGRVFPGDEGNRVLLEHLLDRAVDAHLPIKPADQLSMTPWTGHAHPCTRHHMSANIAVHPN